MTTGKKPRKNVRFILTEESTIVKKRVVKKGATKKKVIKSEGFPYVFYLNQL